MHRPSTASGCRGRDLHRRGCLRLERSRQPRCPFRSPGRHAGEKATGIVVYKLDRLARDLVLQETLLAEVRRIGGEVYSTSDAESGYLTDDPDDPSRKMIRQILGGVAEYERSMIRLRLRSGRRKKAAKGGYAYGSPPYGWESIDGKLEKVEAEQAVLGRMRSLQQEGHSIRQNAETLNAEGAAAKREGSLWHPTTVARALARA